MLRQPSLGAALKQSLHQIPALTLEASVQPITRTVLRLRLQLRPDFRWSDQVGEGGMEGGGEACWVRRTP